VNRYDGVIHLRSIADVRPDLYLELLKNNPERHEDTPEKAVATDKRIEESWLGARVFYIGNETGFDAKINRVIAAIASLLGVPTPKEIERKFLLEPFDIKSLGYFMHPFDVEQYYLTPKNSPIEERVRKMRSLLNGSVYYFHTVKVGSGEVREEIEDVISEEVYNKYLAEGVSLYSKLEAIKKTRYVFVVDNVRYELDQFKNVPHLDGRMYLEVETATEGEVIHFPGLLESHIIKEVTKDPNYKNRAIAN
jgi:CYTH domain-containing protein